MTPKEKAGEMLKTFDNIPRYAKKAVDEILNNDNAFIQTKLQNKYWQEVKQEIEKL